MAKTHYAKNTARPARRDGVLTRQEYTLRARSMAVRGQNLPQAKLLDLDVVAIRSAVRQRESLRKHIRDNLSNDALALRFGVHVRTIEKAIRGESWSHIA